MRLSRARGACDDSTGAHAADVAQSHSIAFERERIDDDDDDDDDDATRDDDDAGDGEGVFERVRVVDVDVDARRGGARGGGKSIRGEFDDDDREWEFRADASDAAVARGAAVTAGAEERADDE